MIEYIKMLIISFITGIFAPLATSSSAHFNFLNFVLDYSEDEQQLGLYFSIISLVFSVVAIFFVRKIYAKGFQSLSKKGSSKLKNPQVYKKMMTSLLISLIPVVLVFIPVSKEKLLSDLFFEYFSRSNILISAFCCGSCGIILLVALWYSKSKRPGGKKSSKNSDVLRMSIYQIPAYIFPGFSHVASAATSLVVGAVDERIILREILIYLAPSSFLISAIRIARFILAGVVLDPVTIAVCAIGALAGNIIMFNIASHLNIRKTFLFISLYSMIFGLLIGTFAFIK